MSKYTFSEPRKRDALCNGKIRCYFNEEIVEVETVIPVEGGEPVTETRTDYIYDAVDVDELTKGAVVEALMRHGITYEKDGETIVHSGLSMSDELALNRQRNTKKAEFNDYNDFAEACKSLADIILSDESES